MSEPPPESLGARIRRIRTDAGLTLTEVAREAGLAKGYMSEIETKGRLPTVFRAYQIASALGTTLDEMVRGVIIDDKPQGDEHG